MASSTMHTPLPRDTSDQFDPDETSRFGETSEEDMADAVQKLSELLREQEEPNVEDSELINRISDQISRLMSAEERGEYEESEDDYSPHGPTTQLAHYPTPFELWEKAHKPDQKAKSARVLTQKGWDELVLRLNDSAKEKQLTLMRKQHQYIAEQLSGLNFSPHINRYSRELASENLKIFDKDRLEHVMKSKRDKVEKSRHHFEQEAIAECTFKPELTAKAKRHNRTVDDLMDYGNVKRLRMRQRRQFVQDLEDREHTFQPQVNQNSMRMMERLKTKGRLRPAGGKRGYRGDSNDPGHSEDTFSPKINRRSKSIQLKGNVYDRLYKSATEKIAIRNSTQEKYIQEHIKGVMVSPLKGALHGNKELSSTNSAKQSGLPDGPINVVRYKHKYAFILNRFSTGVNE
jgi:hypothetical protein